MTQSAPASEAARAFTAQKLALADRIRHDGRLSLSIRLIGAEICSLANIRTGYAWAPEKYLAEKLGVSHRTVKMAVAALKAAGYVRVDKVGRSNRYAPLFGQGQSLPLLESGQGQNLPPSDADRGKIRHQQGQKTTENRGKKVPPISLEISLGISSRAETGAVGAPDGAAGPSFDLGLPGVALRQRLGDGVFTSWLGRVGLVAIEDGELVLSAPTRFLASYIRTHYAEAIVQAWQVQRPDVARLRMIVAASVMRERRKENPDARWLIDVGIGLVAERLHESRDNADRILVAWLKRCGRDAAGLRRILTEAAALDLAEDQFRNVVKQRTRALLQADQTALPLAPVAVSRRA